MGNIINISCGRIWEITHSDMKRIAPPYALITDCKSIIYRKLCPMILSSGITSCIYV